MEASEYVHINTFSSNGITVSDTFNDWRKKDNGVVKFVAGIASSNTLSDAISVSNDGVIDIKDNSITSNHLEIGAPTWDSSGNVTVLGYVKPSRLDFSDSNDPVWITRSNVSADVSQLRVCIGDDGGTSSMDSFIIGRANTATNGLGVGQFNNIFEVTSGGDFKLNGNGYSGNGIGSSLASFAIGYNRTANGNALLRFATEAGTDKTNASISKDSGANSTLKITNYGTGDISLYNSTTELLTVKSTGSVGIGTASPSEKLEVNGNVKATSFLGSATSAGKWTTARTVNFSGDLSGSFSIDGSGDVTAFIGVGSIGTNKIQNFAVTSNKIANGSITPEKLSGGQSGQGPIFGARAWARYSPCNTSGSIITSSYLSSTWVASGTTITINTPSPHNLKMGDKIWLNWTAGTTASDALYTVNTSPTTTSFTVTATTGTFNSSGTRNVTVCLLTIRASGNVSSVTWYNGENGVNTVINFSTEMPSSNYALLVTQSMGVSEDTMYFAELHSTSQLNSTGQAYVRARAGLQAYINIVVFG